MTTREIKNKIQRLLNDLPDNVLEDLLKYLQQAQHQTKDQVEFSLQVKKILKEDRELLEKLSQQK